MDTLLFYGAHPSLSRLEIKSVFNVPFNSSDQFAQLTISKDKVLSLAPRLGSIVFIARIVKESTDPLQDLKKLIEASDKKNIAVTNYSSHQLTKSDLFSLKKKISRSIRFISLETNPDLVPIKKQHADHFILTGENPITISRNIWIHDFNEWNKRDRYKPFRNIKKGMMPPKLARIMLNIVGTSESLTIGDPFCGTGTVLLEGLLLGHTMLGSDNDPISLQGTQSNINWLKSEYSLKDESYTLGINDATSVSKIWSNIDAVVTEPFMGKLIDPDYSKSTAFTRSDLKNIIKGLEKLYTGCLRDWEKVLKPEGKVAILIPEFIYRDEIFQLETIDTCENLGYNIIALEKYTKPGAQLVRNVLLLENKYVKN